MMTERILSRLSLCADAGRLNMPYELFKDYPERLLQEACREVDMLDLGDDLGRMKPETIKRLIEDVEFFNSVDKLLKDGISLGRIEDFIAGAGCSEPLSQYDDSKLEEIMKNKGITNRHQYRYLRYFDKYGLTFEQTNRWMTGLDFLDDCVGTDIQALTEKERTLLWRPVFGTNLLRSVAKADDFWERILANDTMTLMDYLSKQCHSCRTLNYREFLQLTDEPGVILDLLKEILPAIGETARQGFLDIWIKNEALCYDLKKLSKMINNMPEERILQITRKRSAYIGTLYGTELEGIEWDNLSGAKEQLVIYAITNRKKHFLDLIRAQFSVFSSIPNNSLLLDPDFYKDYVNINILNTKNLEECRGLKTIPKNNKSFMKWKGYTFDEIKMLAQQSEAYTSLYHQLQYKRSDDRLRVLRELVKRNCLDMDMPEEDLAKAAIKLSEKSLSNWMQKDFSHMIDLRPQTALQLLIHWKELERFFVDINREIQAVFLLRNRERLGNYNDFLEIREEIVEIDQAWKALCKEFQFQESLIRENRERIEAFIFEGGAEIMYTFYQEEPEKKEEVRRLVIAEILGKFRELKYNRDDLRKEIAFSISSFCEQEWQKNSRASGYGLEVWEEDRITPVMQVGEIPDVTCMSYKSGRHKQCLLSCFDANKKVVFLSMGGKIVFRAIVRLTKGSFSNIGEKKQELEFVDLLEEKKQAEVPDEKELLILFLERPYIKGLPEEEIESAIGLAIQLIERKAKKLNAQLMLSDTYANYKFTKNNFAWTSFYMYISKSKNGLQYLDSLGGQASVSSSGRYQRGRFLILKDDH